MIAVAKLAPGVRVLRLVNVALAGNDGEAVHPDPDQVTVILSGPGS
jgi:hypothetical protein